MKRRATVVSAAVLAAALVLTALLASGVLAGGPTADYGDAPDTTNGLALGMSAYPGVPARFPTDLRANEAPYGPRHANNPAFFILGAAYSAEEGVDSGVDNDLDGTHNIQPAVDAADADGFDDGLEVPDTFVHCQPITLTYEVTVLATYGGPIYANLWADWNHNGAWGGDAPAACPGATTATEWVLQNEPLNLSAPGTYSFDVVFTPWYPDPQAATWLRLTVSEGMAEADGSGPDAGYLYGETEDYRVPGAPASAFLPVVRGGSDPPPPPDPDTHEDPPDPPSVVASWPQVPADGGTATIPEDGLVLRLENFGDFAGEASIDLTIMVNGSKDRLRIGPVPIQPSFYMTDVVIYPSQGVLHVRSPGTIVAQVRVTPDGGDQSGDPAPNQAFDTAPGELYFHESTIAPAQLVVYDEVGYRAQIRAGAFADHPDLWGRLTGSFPGAIHPGMSQIISYVHGDPVLMEPEPDEGHPEGGGGDNIQAPASGNAFTLCLEWYTAPTDNDMGEDYGKNDDGWRARGALVRVYYSGSEVYDGYLNSAGCALINMNAGSGGLVHIEFDGRSLLQAGNGNNILRRVWGWTPPDNPVAWTAAIQINGVQSGATYRPELWGNDAYSILSYAAQERFNGGENGNTLYLVKAGCGLDPQKGSCSAFYDGRHTIFVSNGQWRRKFVVVHEWGHKILSWAASYTNDCSSGSNSHAMESIEYASCAAMEGWAHYVAVDVWNSHAGSSNPGATFVYWNGNIYDVELQYKGCIEEMSILAGICDALGMEKDWMRFWWDFHTNSTPGTAPHHAQMFGIVDDVAWSSGPFAASDAFLDVLGGTLNTRWDSYACWNGIAYDACQ